MDDSITTLVNGEPAGRDALNALCDDLRDLTQLLTVEQEALKAVDIEQVHSVLDTKKDLIERIGQRGKLLGLTGEGDSGASIASLTENVNRSGGSVSDAERLETLAQRCRQINQDNGTLVTRGLDQSRRTLAHLNGLVHENELTLYGASGSVRSHSAGAVGRGLKA